MNESRSRSEKIIEHDPNGLVVLDRKLNIVQFNKAFLQIFEIKISRKILDENVNDILEQVFFPSPDIVTELSKIKQHKKTGKYLQLITFQLHDEEELSACFFVDTTTHFRNKQKLKELKKETLEKSRAVINRQMSVAQEIASLLGETTAESKATLLQLMKILQDEDELHD